jgi:hypothetical protein
MTRQKTVDVANAKECKEAGDHCWTTPRVLCWHGWGPPWNVRSRTKWAHSRNVSRDGSPIQRGGATEKVFLSDDQAMNVSSPRRCKERRNTSGCRSTRPVALK